MDLRDFDRELRRSAVLGWLIMPPFASYTRMIARLTRSPRKRECRIPGSVREEVYIPRRAGGPPIRALLFKPVSASAPLPGLLYLHPGGYVVGNPELSEAQIGDFMSTRDCIVIAPDYRKAFEAPYPAAIDDCYDVLLWMKENTSTLGIRPDQIAVGGHSAGGGLTAAMSLRARDRGEVNIAFQMPIYPMIDDRMECASAQGNNGPLWGSKINRIAWDAYLQGLNARGLPIPYDAAPARASDYRGLPPTMTYVGDLEPFRDETLAYVDNLRKAGVPTEFAEFKGCYHGFDMFAPNAGISRKARAFCLHWFAKAVDSYFAPQK